MERLVAVKVAPALVGLGEDSRGAVLEGVVTKGSGFLEG